MIFTWLTRIPGGRTPAEVFTGSPPVNAYLAELDKRLLGRTAVRMLTLLEVRDHLMERIQFMVESGTDEREAAELAVAALPIDEQVAAQRARLRRKFVSMAVPTGLLWGIFMAVFWSGSGMDGGRTGMSIVTWLVGGVVFGTLFGWFMTFSVAERVPASTAIDSKICVASYSRRMRAASALFVVGFTVLGFGALALGIAGLAGIEERPQVGLPDWALITLGVIGLLDLALIAGGLRRIELADDTLVDISVLRPRRKFELKDLSRLGTLGELRPWLPKYWRRVRFAEFRLPDGRKRRVTILTDMINADRLYVALQNRLQTE